MRKLVLNHANIFQNNKQWPKCLTMKYFHRTIPGLVWTVCSWLTILISRGGGVAVRVSWYAFFEEINSRGRLFRTGELYAITAGHMEGRRSLITQSMFSLFELSLIHARLEVFIILLDIYDFVCILVSPTWQPFSLEFHLRECTSLDPVFI